MRFGEPFGGIMPGARGGVLSVLLRTGAPLTGRRVHALVDGGHGLSAVQRALRDLEELGLTITETVGRAGVHRINEDHVAIPALRAIRSPLEMLAEVVADAAPGVEAVVLFGSVARGEPGPDSDIDLAVVAADDWDGRSTLQEQVSTRLGNGCDVLHLTASHFRQPVGDREPVIDEILRDGVPLVGQLPTALARGAER